MTFTELIKQGLLKLVCLHDYERISKTESYQSSEDNFPRCIIYLYKCKKCGKFKKVIIE